MPALRFLSSAGPEGRADDEDDVVVDEVVE